MRVLILANNDVGLYRFRKELLRRLISEGIEVFVSLPDGDLINDIVSLGCKYIPTKVDRRGMNPIKDIKLLCTYFKIIRDNKPDIVLTYTIKPNVYGGIVCKKCKVPYISNVTGLGTAIEKKGLLSSILLLLYKIALSKAKCVFFQNHTNKLLFNQKNIVRGGRLIPGSGVNLEENNYEAYPAQDKNISMLFVGRIMKDKGIEELLECAEHIKEKYPNCVFGIVGSYDDEQYRIRVEQLHKKGIVIAYGEQKNVHRYMKEYHAIILPSYHEGLSNVLLEGASCGRPILATNVAGCKETFTEGITGLGCEPRNAEALIKVVEKFIIIPYEKKKDMGIQGRKKIEKEFDRNIVVDAYMEEIMG